MKKLSLLVISLWGLCLLSACGGGGGNGGGGGPVIQIAIATQGGLQAIDVAQTLTITATVSNDPSGMGVNWTVTCPAGVNSCGGMAQASTPSGSPNNYNGPANVPSAETVTVKATSISDSTKFGSVRVTVNPALALANPPPVQPQSATAGVPFSLNLTNFVQGGTSPFTWSLTSGALPAGLNLNPSTGMITGTPSAPAAASVFTVTCTDSGNPPTPLPANLELSLTINAAGSLTITSGAPPNGTAGTLYGGTHSVSGHSFTGFPLTATGGTPGYTWSWSAAQGSSLPPGLNISLLYISGGSTRCCVYVLAINGKPTTAGTYNVIVTVTDSGSPAAQTSANYTITIAAAVPPNPVPFISQPLSPDAVLPGGGAFTLTVNGTGFVAGSVVNWNGSPRVTHFVNHSQLTANVLASDLAIANTASVTVVNPAPGGTSNVVFFDVTFPTSSVTVSATQFGVGAAAISVAVGDFNGDGKLDLAVANLASNNVSVLLGNGDGTFQAAVNYGVGSTPASVAVGDFNGDGKLDLVVANAGGTSDNVSVLLGNGDGTFQAAVNYAAGLQPESVAVGDFNGDGKLDLAVANMVSNNVSVLLGNGDGTFQAAMNYGAGTQPFSVAVGDFNGDGRLDLAVANNGSNNVSILLGNGDGTFQAAVNYGAAGTGPISVAVGDFNGDGKLDLAVSSNNVSVLLGNGDGTFQAAVSYGAGGNQVVVADFNGDGKPDLAVASDPGNNVSILLGNGDGTFQSAVAYGAGAAPPSVTVGDFNGDGRLDLAAADNFSGQTGSTVSVLLQGTVQFSETAVGFANQAIGTSSAAQSVTVTNVGAFTVNITSIGTTGTNAGEFGVAHNCGSSIASGASCTINVTFTPAQVGPRTASVMIMDDAPGNPQSLALSGTGLAMGQNATLSSSSLTFVTQLVGTTSAAQAVTLSNFGTMTLSITSIAATANFGESDNCGSSVASGASCTISVTFTPSTRGGLMGMLSVTDNAPGSPQAVSLNGTGTVVSLAPAALSFSCPPGGCAAPPQMVTLTNTGSTTLNITGITITGNGSNHFSQTNTCGTSVGAGLSCTITVTFSAGSGAATYTGNLSISDDGGGSPQTVRLTGTVRRF